jgi:hypothetical protein
VKDKVTCTKKLKKCRIDGKRRTRGEWQWVGGSVAWRWKKRETAVVIMLKSAQSEQY